MLNIKTYLKLDLMISKEEQKKKLEFLLKEAVSLKVFENPKNKPTYWATYWAFLTCGKWIRISKTYFTILFEDKKLQCKLVKNKYEDFLDKQHYLKLEKIRKKIQKVFILYMIIDKNDKKQLWGIDKMGKKICILKTKIISDFSKQIMSFLQDQVFISAKNSRYFTKNVKFELWSKDWIVVDSPKAKKKKERWIPILFSHPNFNFKNPYTKEEFLKIFFKKNI